MGETGQTIGMFSSRRMTRGMIEVFVKHGYRVRVVVEKKTLHYLEGVEGGPVTFYPCTGQGDTDRTIRELQAQGFFDGLDRLFNVFDLFSGLYFRINELYPWLRDDHYYNCRNCSVKNVTRQILRECGIDDVPFATFEPDDIPNLAISDQGLFLDGEVLGFELPCVIKPAIGTAGWGVRIIKTQEEMAAYQADFKSAQTRGTIPDTDLLLCEQFIHGAEFECDGYVVNGTICMIMYGIKIFDNSVFPKEIGSILSPYGSWGRTFPYLKDPSDWVKQLISAIAYRNGVFHIEGKVAPDGTPHLIEFNPRCGGGTISHSGELISNVSLYLKCAELFIGVNSEIVEPESLRDKTILTVPVYAQNIGSVENIRPLDYLHYEDGQFSLDGAWIPLLMPGDVVARLEAELYIGEIQLYLTADDIALLGSEAEIQALVERVMLWSSQMDFFDVM